MPLDVAAPHRGQRARPGRHLGPRPRRRPDCADFATPFAVTSRPTRAATTPLDRLRQVARLASAADASSASGQSGALELSVAVTGRRCVSSWPTSVRFSASRLLRRPRPGRNAPRPPRRRALFGRACRTLRFTGERNTSTTGSSSSPPASRRPTTLDLATWALAAVNGAEPLAPGSYDPDGDLRSRAAGRVARRDRGRAGGLARALSAVLVPLESRTPRMRGFQLWSRLGIYC